MWVRPLWGAAVLFFCCIAFAQEAPVALPGSTFHARSELVQLNVVVHDKAGAHIPGLKQSDFKVFEAGRPRDIAFFEEVHPQPLPPAESGVFSNLSTSNERRSVTMILLDLLNTEATDQARARELLVSQFTKIKLTPNPTALFVLNSRGLQVVHDFTTDSAALAAALQRVALELRGLTSEAPLPGTTQPEGSLTSPDWVEVLNATRTMLAAINEPLQPLESSRRWTMTIGALAQIEFAVNAIAGRKSLVWIAGQLGYADDFGFSASTGNGLQFGLGADVLVSETLAVYPVDVRGLLAFNFDEMIQRATDQTAQHSRSMLTMNTPAYAAVKQNQDIMHEIADATGGRAFLNRNDLGACVREAMDDSSAFYTIAFYARPSNRSTWERRTLKVQLLAPHAEVRTRNYYTYRGDATANGHPARLTKAMALRVQQELSQRLKLAITSPLDSTDLPLSLKWAEVEPWAVDTKKVNFQLKLPLSLDPAGQMNLELRMFMQQPDGSWLLLSQQQISGRPRPRQIAQSSSQSGFVSTSAIVLKAGNYRGFVLTSAIILKAGNHRVRAVARDVYNGRIGTITAPITVP